MGGALGDVRRSGMWEAAALGWIEDRDYELFRDSERELRLVNVEHSLPELPLAFVTVAALESTGGLTEEDRDTIAGKVLAAATEEATRNQPGDLWCASELLEYLGRASLNSELANPVKRALLACWAEAPGDEQACFGPNSTPFEHDEGGLPVPRSLPSAWLESTHHAICLMGRFGVPEEIEFAPLAAYLREQKRHGYSLIDGSDVIATAALDRLTVLNGGQAPVPGLWALLAELRVVLAIGLLVCFCLVTTFRAPMSRLEEC